MNTVEKAGRIETGTYAVDTVHSQIGFEVKHLGISTFRGSFGDFAGEVKVGENGIEAVDGSIEVASVKVPEEKLQGHLLSPDFFDAEANPEGTFKSTSVEKVDEETYRVTGDLTLRGVTKTAEVELEVEGAGIGMDGSAVLSLKAAGKVNRNDYGISWGATLDSGAAVVGEKVNLVITIEAVKAGE
ncbi:MAG: YceI family protein [Solirubrobacterales bacterium]